MRFAVAALFALAVGLPAAGAEDKPDQSAPQAQPAPQAPEKSAQPAAPAEKPAPPPSKAAQNLARALLPEQEWNRILDRYATSLSGQLTQSLSATGEAVPDDLGGSVRQKLGERLPYQETMQRHAQALGGHFTSDELNQAAKFYSSKLGAKVLRELPGAQDEVGKFLQTRLAAVVPEIVKQVAPKALEGPKSAPGPGPDEPAGKAAPPQARKPPATQGTHRP